VLNRKPFVGKYTSARGFKRAEFRPRNNGWRRGGYAFLACGCVGGDRQGFEGRGFGISVM